MAVNARLAQAATSAASPAVAAGLRLAVGRDEVAHQGPQGADVGDTTTIIETAIAAAEQVEDAQANVDDRQSLEEIVGDKGYHSNQTLIDLDAGGIRSYVSEPDRGRPEGEGLVGTAVVRDRPREGDGQGLGGLVGHPLGSPAERGSVTSA